MARKSCPGRRAACCAQLELRCQFYSVMLVPGSEASGTTEHLVEWISGARMTVLCNLDTGHIVAPAQ